MSNDGHSTTQSLDIGIHSGTVGVIGVVPESGDGSINDTRVDTLHRLIVNA